MAITSCSQKIYNAFYSDDLAKGLFHGHTYTANPLGCTAALAGIQLLTSQEIQEDIKRIIKKHQAFDKEIKTHSKVAQTRQCGIIYALDLKVTMARYGGLRDKLFNHFMENGVFLRPLGNTIYILPPYVITDAELHKIYEAIKSVLSIV